MVNLDPGADINTYGFWKTVTTVIFDVQILNLDAVSYLRMTPKKALGKAKEENKD